MAKVVVRFFDDETVEGVARDLDFDEPDFLVEVDDAGGLENNETAWIPLTAVKWVELQRDKDLADTPTRKVAIRPRVRCPRRGGRHRLRCVSRAPHDGAAP